ncbi:MAG: hypothetical protein ACFFF9_08965 [Candidatus Thorarchaeota archaeon]
MSHAYDSGDLEREIEIGIVSAFGWSVIEFEAVLFQKFLVMSGSKSLTTEDMFRNYLRNMEAKGYVSPLEFHGRRAWKRLVIESEIEEPAMTPEEVKEFIAKAQEANKQASKKKKVVGKQRVNELHVLADNIIRTLDQVMPSLKKQKKPWERSLIDHIERMHKALTESKDEFLKYVKKNLPPAYEPMNKLLNSKGEEMFLLSLRVIESGQRAYPS